MSEKLHNREVIFEFLPVGNVMKVSAMDTATLTEVVIQGPVNAGEEILKKSALARLEYVLRKEGKIP